MDIYEELVRIRNLGQKCALRAKTLAWRLKQETQTIREDPLGFCSFAATGEPVTSK